MEKHIAACGMDCNACPIPKIHTNINKARKWIKQFRDWKVINDNEGAEEIMAKGPYCINCQADQSVHWSADCWILKCCVDDKKLNNCSECQNFPCEKLSEHFNKSKHHQYCQNNLTELRTYIKTKRN